MKRKHLFFLLILAILATAAAIAIFYSFYVIKEVKTIDMHVKVEDYVGFNLDTDKLYFGTVMPGGSAKRSISIFHNYTYPVKVKIFIQGYISNWVKADKTEFTVQPNEKLDVPFNVYVPKETPYGNYTGKIKLVFTRW